MIHQHLFDIPLSGLPFTHFVASCYTCPTCAKITPCALVYTHTRECMETIQVLTGQTLIWSWEWRELSKHAPIILWEFQLTVYRTFNGNNITWFFYSIHAPWIPSILMFNTSSPMMKQSPRPTDSAPVTPTADWRKSVESPIVSGPSLKSTSILESFVNMFWPLLRTLSRTQH